VKSDPASIAARLLEDDPVQGGAPDEISGVDAKEELLAARHLTDYTNDQMAMAVDCYNARKNRKRHPDGYFERNGTWWPSPTERRPCCLAIRQPSARFPWSLMLHCRTAVHVANLFNVSVVDLKKAVR